MMSVDPNDPEVIESLTYLLVSKEERIQTQTRPFDGKKNVFVHCAKEGYVPAEIIESDGKIATCRTEKGYVIINIYNLIGVKNNLKNLKMQIDSKSKRR